MMIMIVTYLLFIGLPLFLLALVVWITARWGIGFGIVAAGLLFFLTPIGHMLSGLPLIISLVVGMIGRWVRQGSFSV